MRSGGGIRALLKGPGSGKLYSGLWGNLAGVAPASALFFSVYQPCKHAISERLPEQQQFIGPLMAGALAGLAASLVRVPTEVVKQRMQTREFQGLFQAVCIRFPNGNLCLILLTGHWDSMSIPSFYFA